MSLLLPYLRGDSFPKIASQVEFGKEVTLRMAAEARLRETLHAFGRLKRAIAGARGHKQSKASSGRARRGDGYGGTADDAGGGTGASTGATKPSWPPAATTRQLGDSSVTWARQRPGAPRVNGGSAAEQHRKVQPGSVHRNHRRRHRHRQRSSSSSGGVLKPDDALSPSSSASSSQPHSGAVRMSAADATTWELELAATETALTSLLSRVQSTSSMSSAESPVASARARAAGGTSIPTAAASRAAAADAAAAVDAPVPFFANGASAELLDAAAAANAAAAAAISGPDSRRLVGVDGVSSRHHQQIHKQNDGLYSSLRHQGFHAPLSAR